MIHHPDIQRDIQSELEKTGDLITWSERHGLPLTEATVAEVLRIGNVGAITPPRLVKVTQRGISVQRVRYLFQEPFHCAEHIIPAGTVVTTTTYSVHMDTAYWGDPETFRPDRFLVEDKFLPDERNIPFGLGRRRCLGENLARMEGFLFFSNLLKHFTFSSPDTGLPSLEPEPGLTYGPKPFPVLAREV